ncbi:MAG: hypothetical protein WBX11_11980 [Thiobacillaceae bacterium]
MDRTDRHRSGMCWKEGGRLAVPWGMVLWFCLSSLPNLACADDYVLDVNARNYAGRADLEGEPFESPQDPKVCKLYLQNLRYFAKRNLPLSCGQPVAPMLAGKLKPVQWEDLNPEKYPELFKAVVTRVFPPRPSEAKDYPSEAALSSWRQAVRNGDLVFRRAKLELSGHLLLPSQYSPTKEATAFQIIQFGFNVTDPANPDPRWRCEQSTGRVMPVAHGYLLRPFVASGNLREFISELHDSHLGFGASAYSNLWLINGQPYGELYDENGNVLLSQITLDPAVFFDRVCLFRYKKTLSKDR